MENHRTVHLEYDKQSAEVDEGIAPLILELWKADIWTLMCCEENRPGIMWIEFVTTMDAEEFLNIIAPYEEGIESLYNRVRQEWGYSDSREVAGLWEYSVHPDDFSVSETENENGDWVEHSTGDSNFNFSLGVRFPKSDYPLLLERIKEFNEKKINPQSIKPGTTPNSSGKEQKSNRKAFKLVRNGDEWEIEGDDQWAKALQRIAGRFQTQILENKTAKECIVVVFNNEGDFAISSDASPRAKMMASHSLLGMAIQHMEEATSEDDED